MSDKTNVLNLAEETAKKYATEIERTNKSTSPWFNGSTFLHDEFAQYMIQRYQIIMIDDLLHYFTGTHYEYLDDNEFRRMVIKILPILTEQKRKDVYYNVLGRATVKERSHARFVSLKNGVFDVKDKKFVSDPSDYVITNHIPVTYDANASSEVLEYFLNEISNHKKDIRLLIEEAIGYCLYRSAFMHKAFFIVARGSNGKSTLFNMLYDFFGDNNAMPFSLKDMENNFKLSGTINKLVLIGDDISSSKMEDTEIFKKMVSGERIYADKKRKDAFTILNTATLMYSANELPPIHDQSNGLSRRLVIIPFERTFSHDNDNLDLEMPDKLKSDAVKSTLLNYAIDGLHRILENKRFTEPEEVTNAIHEYKVRNNILMQYVEDKRIENILDHETDEVYKDFSIWCMKNGLKAKSKTFLTRSLSTTYGIEIKRTTKRVNGYPQVFKYYVLK
ncbi:phage/plasmid primase, P4 family [Macrococcus sp. EM39E]|uniref:DNA primase family protein n=1 Tax=Macrococcus animalis TaxID=3395467 RepID=UPI0039BDAF4D